MHAEQTLTRGNANAPHSLQRAPISRGRPPLVLTQSPANEITDNDTPGASSSRPNTSLLFHSTEFDAVEQNLPWRARECQFKRCRRQRRDSTRIRMPGSRILSGRETKINQTRTRPLPGTDRALVVMNGGGAGQPESVWRIAARPNRGANVWHGATPPYRANRHRTR